MDSLKDQKAVRLFLLRALCVSLALLTGACAASSRAPETGRPRPNEPPYPVVLAASDERREKSLAVWTALATEQGIQNPPAPELQPVTATLRALPTLAQPLYLPQVGGEGGKVPTDEETRESLRRFIESTAPLLGIETRNISLVAVTDEAGGAKRARYEQKPFSYPLRGGYGIVEMVFTPDRRILEFSSTAIPETERVSRALTSITVRVTAENAVANLAGRAVTVTDANGQQRNITVSAGNETAVRELVVYPMRNGDSPGALELHLAWEVAAGPGAQALVYVDAVSGATLAATPASQVSARL